MTTSETPERAYVWSWLPGEREPIPTGVLEAIPAPGGHVITFAYGQSYLANEKAIPLYLPELPLRRGRIEPAPDLDVAGVIRDGGPDAWGQRVIMRQLMSGDARDRDPGDVPILTYLLRSGSNRSGSLDFQESPSEYFPRVHGAPLEDLMRAADSVQAGEELERHLGEALAAGSSAGGARPKVTLIEESRDLIAKFSSPTDSYPVIKAEAAAMKLAEHVGLQVAKTELVQVSGRDVLLVERFDRGPGGTRRGFVSALTILGLHELAGRHATYHDLADVIRRRFIDRRRTLRELFSRIVFNILVGNTDDHARNHAAFWDGERLDLTPAYDICPQARAGGEQAQAMAIAPDGGRLSQVTTCLAAARHYNLTESDARLIIDRQLLLIAERWDETADLVGLTDVESRELWRNQILNPFATYGYDG